MLTEKECKEELAAITGRTNNVHMIALLNNDTWKNDARNFFELGESERHHHALLLASAVYHSGITNEHYEFKAYLKIMLGEYMPKEFALDYLLLEAEPNTSINNFVIIRNQYAN